MFITFEGIDGSGKTTQLELAAKYLEANGIEVLKIREPGGTQLSEKIRNLLLDPDNSINSISELLLFEAARADLTEKAIKPALAENKFVLCDRFYDSTTAYQGYGRGIKLEIIEKLNMFATQDLVPDLSFYFHISLPISKERTSSKKLDRMESAGDEFFKNVIEGFEKISSIEDNRFVKIDSEASIEIIHSKIIKIILDKYKYLRNIS